MTSRAARTCRSGRPSRARHRCDPRGRPAGTDLPCGQRVGRRDEHRPGPNPTWPLAGTNIVYEVHSYVDAYNNGNGFDWDAEVAKNFTAGFGTGPVTVDTGLNRMRIATDWAAGAWHAQSRSPRPACRSTIRAGSKPSAAWSSTRGRTAARSRAGWAATIGRRAATASTMSRAGTRAARSSRWWLA